MTGRREPRWLSQSIIETIHTDQIEQHGGSHGVRDEGLLASALDRAPNRWHYDSAADLVTLAAAYGVGIAKNHAFLDGNERTAFLAMYVFLGINGLTIVAPEPDVVAIMLDVATGVVDEVRLAEWLRAHARRARTLKR